MEKDLVSIITPLYNSEKFIEETYESIKNQTYEKWEWIVIDDCSKDKSLLMVEIFKKNDDRIKIIKNQSQIGAAECRNKGIKYSKGEFVAFLDSDDIWTLNKLEVQVKFMRKNNADFSYTEYSLISENGVSLNKIAKVLNKITYKKILFHNYIGCLTAMYNQEIIGEIQGANLKNTNDYALFLEILKKSKNAMGISENMGYYRIRKGSISRSKLKKIKPHFKLLYNIEKINIFYSLLYILTHNLIKKIWKYKKEN